MGHTNQEVARRLFVSVRTVETHRARIRDMLGTETRAELIAAARRARAAGMTGMLRAKAGPIMEGHRCHAARRLRGRGPPAAAPLGDAPPRSAPPSSSSSRQR
ncbi:response regulator transcription factor [Streptomyces sp. L7]